MKRQKVSIYSSTLSLFGAAFLQVAIQHPALDIVEVVLASPDLWWKFHCRLQGRAWQAVPNRIRYKQDRQKKAILKVLARKHPTAEVRMIDTIHQEEEYSRLRRPILIFCGGFPELFKSAALTASKLGIVNFHPSYLPRCRGAHPIYWTIAKREPYGGVSTHIMVEEIDAGPIICREKITFEPEQITYPELFQLIEQHLPLVITKTLQQLAAGQVIPAEQIDEPPSYHRNDREVDHCVNWEQDDFIVISAKIRAGHAFMHLSSAEKLFLEPPIQIYPNAVLQGALRVGYLETQNDGLRFRSRDGRVFSCGVRPLELNKWQRMLHRLFRLFPAGRHALPQHIGQRKLKAHY